MTAKKRIVFVVNPISGTQGKKAILKWIDERIDRALFDYSIVKTQYGCQRQCRHCSSHRRRRYD